VRCTGGTYRRVDGYAKSAAVQLDPRRRLAVVAAIGDCVIAAAARVATERAATFSKS
jgi:hypothetical protein